LKSEATNRYTEEKGRKEEEDKWFREDIKEHHSSCQAHKRKEYWKESLVFLGSHYSWSQIIADRLQLKGWVTESGNRSIKEAVSWNEDDRSKKNVP
jgi:hypothetical protein